MFQLARIASTVFEEKFHAKAELGGIAVRVEEIEENAGRGQVATGTIDNRHARILQAVHGPPDVIDIGDHEVDVVKAVRIAGNQPETVVQRIGPGSQPFDYAFDVVGADEAKLVHPEAMCGPGIGHIDDNVPQSGDLCEVRLVRALGRCLRVVECRGQPACRIGELKSARGGQCLAAFRIGPLRGEAKRGEHGKRLVEFSAAFQLKTGFGEARECTLFQHKIERFVTTPQARDQAILAGHFQADHIAVEGHAARQIRAAQAAKAKPGEAQGMVHSFAHHHKIMLMRAWGRRASISSTQVFFAIIRPPFRSTISCR